MDSNSRAVTRAVNEIPASRPGPISIIVMVIAFGIIFSVGNWKLVSSWFS